MTVDASRIPADWRAALGDELTKPYVRELAGFLAAERGRSVVFPPERDVFRALHTTALAEVRVVIVGQDPYPTRGHAHGLAFSVRDGVKHAPSLRNILKEVSRDLDVPEPVSGELTSWAQQGVLLLNRVLTVREGEIDSHKSKGWEKLTSALLAALSRERDGLVFLAWGKKAEKAVQVVDQDRHLAWVTSHPSPLGERHGFRGCGHFSAVNEILVTRGQAPIDWSRTGPDV